MKGWGAPSLNSRTTSSWRVELKVGKALQRDLEGLDQWYDVQLSQVLGPVLGSKQLHQELQAGVRVVGKLPSSEGPDISKLCPGGQESQWHSDM